MATVTRKRRPTIAYRPKMGPATVGVLLLRGQAEPTNRLLLRATDDNLAVRSQTLSRLLAITPRRTPTRAELPQTLPVPGWGWKLNLRSGGMLKLRGYADGNLLLHALGATSVRATISPQRRPTVAHEEA